MMCHEPAIRAGAFLHVANYCGDVVANGLTTMNVWEGLQTKLSQEEIRRYWSPISPLPYLPKLLGSDKKILAMTGSYDPTFWPEFTNAFFSAVPRSGLEVQRMSLPCGHYSMGVAPFKWAVGFRFGTFLFQSLS
jgi:hypothetical protein